MESGIDAELKRLLDELPPSAARMRSRLEPYQEYVLRWKRQGRSYEEIRAILREKCGLVVAKSTLVEFVQRRRRRGKQEAPAAATTQQGDRWGEARERMRAFKNAPPIAKGEQELFVYTEEDEAKPLEMLPANKPWHFDVDKPRTIQKASEEKKVFVYNRVPLRNLNNEKPDSGEGSS